MQIIQHKNSTLSIAQRFFIERSLELLYIGSIDSYRTRLNNPKTILEELKYCLQQYELGRIKHFVTIKADRDRKVICDEAIMLLSHEPNYLYFGSISLKYLEKLLKELNEHNYKKVISAIDIVLTENSNYITSIIDGLEVLLHFPTVAFDDLDNIDKTLNILFSELIHLGFSKGFLYKLVYGIFVNSLREGHEFESHFHNFKNRILDDKITYKVIFRIDTTQKVYDSISAISNPILVLADNIDEVQPNVRQRSELESFNSHASARKFISCHVVSFDYLAALKHARTILSEYLDVVNLGLSDEFLNIHHRALVMDTRTHDRGDFQNNINILDGKYKVEKEHY